MRRLLFTLSVLFSTTAFAQTLLFPGNGNSNFGGAIGQGSLAITEKQDTISFKLNKGPGTFDSLLVFYIDEPNTTTGISTTSTLTFSGVPDKYSNAVTGKASLTQQAVLNFPPAFQPDLAVVFDKDGGKVFFLFQVFGMGLAQDQGTFTVSPSGTNNSPSYTATTYKSQYGLLPTDTINFNFMGTYIGQTASRSNEAIGDPFTSYLRVAGYNPYTVQSWFNFSSARALPVNLVELRATSEAGAIKVRWSAAQEINIDAYEVQRSANGRDFTTIATVKARNASTTTNYTVEDEKPLAGNNYYCLRIIERGGVQVSKVIVVRNGESRSSFNVVQAGNTLSVQLKDLAAGEYRLNIINSNGQLVQSAIMKHDGANGSHQVSLKGSPARGIYRLVLQSADTRLTHSMVIQ